MKRPLPRFLRELFGFWTVGFLAAGVNYALYALFVHEGFHYLVGSLVGFVVSVFICYLLNGRYVFKKRDATRRDRLRTLAKTYISYGLTGVAVHNLLLFLWIDVVDLSCYVGGIYRVLTAWGIETSTAQLAKYLAPLINLLVTAPMNFLLNKYWTFRND